MGKNKGGSATNSATSKKVTKKEEERVIQDKTFGLKNKNKSTKVQKFIKGVVLKVKTGGNIKGGEGAILNKQMEEKNAKKKEEEKQALLESLFKSVSNIQQQQPKQGEDPKSILCALFKAGQCKKGDNCKFSHDLTIANKSAKIDIYTDVRDASGEGMESWNQDYLENVVNSKFRGRIKPSKEVCKHFIEALEKKVFGWLWECPNGDKCQYRHCLPPNYLLKSDKGKLDKKQEIPLEEQLEFERAKLPTEGLTPVTKDSFFVWKKKKQEENEKKKQEELISQAKKITKGFNSILSGRALFQYIPEIFKDEDDAVDQYQDEKEEESTKEEEKKEIGKQWVKEDNATKLSDDLIKNIKASIEQQNELAKLNGEEDDEEEEKEGKEENKEEIKEEDKEQEEDDAEEENKEEEEDAEQNEEENPENTNQTEQHEEKKEEQSKEVSTDTKQLEAK